MEELQDLNQPSQQLLITENVKRVLLEARKWSKFLAILGFIGLGFLILFGFIFVVAGNLIDEANIDGYSNLQSSAMGIYYVISAIIYVIPLVFLLNFSNKLKVAINSNDPYSLYAAFNSLRLHYKFIGILTIIMFVLMFFFVFIGIIVGIVTALG